MSDLRSPATVAHNRYREAEFVLGAASERGFPLDEGAEVAFAGRSNAGKSSAINALTGRRSLARTSKTPGRTRELNFFDLRDGRRLVDLPGYGFAKVSKEDQRRWGALIHRYLSDRASLRGIVVLVDSRREPTDLDLQLLRWCVERRLEVQCLLTKSDKLSRNQANKALAAAKKSLGRGIPGEDTLELIGVQLFSAVRGDGLPELVQRLDSWLWPDEL